METIRIITTNEPKHLPKEIKKHILEEGSGNLSKANPIYDIDFWKEFIGRKRKEYDSIDTRCTKGTVYFSQEQTLPFENEGDGKKIRIIQYCIEEVFFYFIEFELELDEYWKVNNEVTIDDEFYELCIESFIVVPEFKTLKQTRFAAIDM